MTRALAIAAIVLLGCGDAARGRDPDAGPSGTPVRPLLAEDAFYPRAIALADGTVIASVVAPQPSGRLGGTILESTDGGVTFAVVGRIDGDYSLGGVCCATLFELVSPIGALPAGALLWAISAGNDAPGAPMRIPLFASLDRGRTWTFQTDLAVAEVARSDGGLWEPELVQLDDGSLVVHYSDETHDRHSQKLVARRSTDGVVWGEQRDTVALPAWAARPGMPTIRRLADGRYAMGYEICGTDGCAARLRTSTDGWDFGDPTEEGLRPVTLDGEHFRHAPTLAFHPAPGANGRVYLIGQMLYDRGGQVAGGNGRVILVSSEGGGGRWYEVAAPVPVPDPSDNFCPNYRSTVLPLEGGAVALELASMWDGDRCRTFYARGPLAGDGDDRELVEESAYRFESLHSGRCLDVVDGSTAPGAPLRLWDCAESAAQRFRIARREGGASDLIAEGSGLCLAASGPADAAGEGLIQTGCDPAAPGWRLENIGLGYYRVVREGGDVCLDVAGGSLDRGAAAQQWHCNDLAPQIWRLTR